ncbi:MAG: acetyltransferase [Acidobacteriia bacterium]|nr:acetyltransferase [Terriglobia bacterium]
MGKAMMPQSSMRRRMAADSRAVVCVLVLTRGVLGAQELMTASAPGGVVQLFASDAAILESRETRKDLPCTVTPVKPTLGFDLKFHTGYDLVIPLKDLAGSENTLTTVFRVTAENRPDEPVYFSRRIAVPAIDEDEKGPAYLQGNFDVGEGKYHVDWLMRDRLERICSSNWDLEAVLPPKDKQMALDIPGNAIRPADTEPFKQEPPVEREQRDGPLNVKVMINFAPQDAQSATLQPLDTNALLSILRSIARDPRICKFSIVAFNMQEQRVVYRQDAASQIDFPAMGDALKSLSLGTVDLKRLSQKHGDSEFLSRLITTEVKDDKARPDAVIFAGPKVVLDDGLPPDTLKQLGDVKLPVFYMNYNLNPQANPWRDAIGNAVHSLKGLEFTISRPRDLFFAWSEIIGRIVKSKVRPGTGSAASQ